jgi:hypothetical protein
MEAEGPGVPGNNTEGPESVAEPCHDGLYMMIFLSWTAIRMSKPHLDCQSLCGSR